MPFKLSDLGLVKGRRYTLGSVVLKKQETQCIRVYAVHLRIPRFDTIIGKLVEMEDTLNKLQEAELKVKELEVLQAKCNEHTKVIDHFTSQLKAAEEKLLDLAALQKASSEGKSEIENIRQELEAAEKQIKSLESEKDAESGKVCSDILHLFFLTSISYLELYLIFQLRSFILQSSDLVKTATDLISHMSGVSSEHHEYGFI